jgi:hypothetical protein
MTPAKIGYFIGYAGGMVIEMALEALFTAGIATAAKVVLKYSKKLGEGVTTAANQGANAIRKVSQANTDTFIKQITALFESLRKKEAMPLLQKWIDDLILEIKKALGLVDEVAVKAISLSDEALKILKAMADGALKWPSKNRPKACSVLEGKGSSIFNYNFKQKLPVGKFPEDLHPLVDKWIKDMWELHKKGTIELPKHHGKCAEVRNISEWLKRVDPDGKMTIREAREAFEGVVSHAKEIGDVKQSGRIVVKHNDYKKACNSCNPLLKYFNIVEYKIK